MIKLTAGKYGPKLLGPGTVLNLDVDTEERMVERKVAVYINSDGKNVDNDNSSDMQIMPLSIEQLNKMKSKKELIKYAESVGLHDLNEADKKETLVDAIANYLEEYFEE